MKFLVRYVDFHWDNHQGGSGKSFCLSQVVEIEGSVAAEKILDEIMEKIKCQVIMQRPFDQSAYGYQAPAIQSIEVLV